MAAIHGCVRNVPTRIRNSPTKPFVPGSPTEDSATTTSAKANTGITFAIPPKSAISREWRRSYSIPMRRKSAPVEIPWFTIWRMPPSIPWVVSPNTPSTTKPRWATEV